MSLVLELPFPPRGDALTDSVVFGDRDGVLRAVDGATGGLRWQTRIGTAVWAPPALADDIVAVGPPRG